VLDLGDETASLKDGHSDVLVPTASSYKYWSTWYSSYLYWYRAEMYNHSAGYWLMAVAMIISTDVPLPPRQLIYFNNSWDIRNFFLSVLRVLLHAVLLNPFLYMC
jgi:hypothetical protein